MRPSRVRPVVAAFGLLLIGCGGPKPAPPTAPGVAATPEWSAGGPSDSEKVRTADVSVLFVGNSHTTSHDLPGLVCRMIRFRRPGATAYAHVVGVGFLEDVARDPRAQEEIDSRPWKFVVLQAQKISMSGRYEYSRQEGIDFAKRAKDRGATVFFYPEWGLKGVTGDGPRTEAVYRAMAEAAGVGMAPVARAWDLALARRPDLPLHADDGNHQAPSGAYLTACVLVGRLTGESPAPLAAFPYPEADPELRQFLAGAAAEALVSDGGSNH